MSTPMTPATLDSQHDSFADWLSPILVKELRQGLKTYVFATIFIGIQLVMILTFGIQVLNHHSPSADFDDTSGFFWAMIWIPALLIMPLRGMSAVTEEYKAQTLELMQMTHMSSFRIVLGKWIGIVAQTLLLISSLLPYAILRYFFGGVDLASDLKKMAMIVLASAMFSAAAITISTLQGALRGLVSIGFVWSVMALSNLSRFLFGSGSSSFFFGPTLSSWRSLAAFGLVMIVYTAFSLEIASSRIAPEAENHALRKRLLALGILLAAIAFVASVKVLEMNREYGLGALWLSLPILIWTMVDALTELPIANPQSYRAMATRPWIVRRLGMAFHPGWQSGLLYSLIVLGLFSLALGESVPTSAKPGEVSTMMILASGWLLTPLLPLLWMKNLKQRMMGFLVIQLLCFLAFTIVNIVNSHPNPGLSTAETSISFIPSCAFYVALEEGPSNGVVEHLVPIAGVVTLGILAILLLRALTEFRLMLKVERITRQVGDR